MRLRLMLIKNIIQILRPVFTICFMVLCLVSADKVNASNIYTAQQDNRGFNISGYVYDEKGEAVIGAYVISMENKNIGTTTDENGFFRLTVPSANNEIQVSIIGFKRQTLKIDGKSNFKITLQSDIEQLDDVVVMGYFSKAKNSFTGTAVSVGGDELRTVNNTSFFDALKVFDPSFQIVDTRELNGANPNFIPNQISIRGENSFPEISESELQTNVSLPIFLLDGFEVNVQKVYDLDMNRIESVTILKDASASAIYGSRAANGVVVIETKLPEPGVLKVSYTLNGTFQVPDLSSYNLMNASEVLEFQRLAGQFTHNGSSLINPGSYLNTYNLIKREIMAGVDDDWLKKPLRTGFQHRHTVMIEGSVKPQDVSKENNMRYAVNLSVAQVDGLMKGSDRNSYGFGTKFIYDKKNLRISNDLQFTMVTSKNSPYGSFSTYTSILPYHRERDEEGNYYNYLSLSNVRPSGMEIDNNYSQKSPIYEAKYLNSYTGTETLGVTDNIGINWDITSELKVKGNFSLGYDFERKDAYVSPLSFDSTTDSDVVTSDALFQRGKYELGNIRNMTYEGNVMVSYFKTFGKHDLQAILGGELKERQENSDAFTVTGFLNDALGYPTYGLQYLLYGKPTGSEDLTRTMGAFSNINYSYDSRYLFDLTGRLDGSSLYGRNKMYYKYWSIGFRWNLHRESFLSGFENIDLLALRLNIGTTGNQNFRRNQAMSLYTYLNNPYGNFFGASISVLGNPDLEGQLTLNRNVGFEVSLFRNNFNFNFNYYYNTTKNNLTDITIAPSIGFDTYKTNMGDLTNKGVEFSMTVIPIRTKDVLLSFNWNGAHNKNKITKISDALKKYNETVNQALDDKEDNTSTVFLFEEGQSMNTIYAVRSLGIDPGTGKEIYLTVDGEKTFDWKSQDQVAVGNTEPTLRGYFGFNFRYKGWEVGGTFGYSFGADKYNYTLYERIENINYNVNNDKRALTERWQKPGDVAKYKAIGDQSTTKATSRFVQRENKIEMTSLRFTYTMPPHILKDKFISMWRFSVTCNDLFHASTVKQERGLTYPYARTVSFSTQLNF